MTEKSKIQLIRNAENRFFYDRRRNVIHDRQCSMLKNLDADDLDALSDLTPSYIGRKVLCPKCKRMAAIRNGMRGNLRTRSEQLWFFTDFFTRAGAQNCDLVRIFIFGGGSLWAVSQDCIEIHVNEDLWRVSVEGGVLTLLHNNYDVNEDYTRTFCGGFHLQCDGNLPTFHNFTKIMCEYSFDYHKRVMKEYDARVRQLRFESTLAIANNYVRRDRRSLLHAYYTFVGFPNDKKAFRVRGMKVLENVEMGNYIVITCRVPRWRRREFENMMDALKETAKAEQRFDYPDICESAVPQLA